MAEDELPEQVGYGSPPESGKFKKGQSGNPNGRPKGTKNLSKTILDEIRQKVRIKGLRGPRWVTKLKAAAMQLANRAAQGDLRALRELFALVRASEEETDNRVLPETLREADQMVLQSLRKRISSFSADASFNNPEPKKEESK